MNLVNPLLDDIFFLFEIAELCKKFGITVAVNDALLLNFFLKFLFLALELNAKLLSDILSKLFFSFYSIFVESPIVLLASMVLKLFLVFVG